MRSQSPPQRTQRRPVRRTDLQRPGESGRFAEELLVPPVAPAADPLGKQQPGRGRVEHRAHACPGAADDECAGGAAEQDAAPDAKAAVPDLEHAFPFRVGNDAPAGDDVVEPCTDDSGGDSPEADAVDEVPVAAHPRPAAPSQPERRNDSGEQHQPVHVQR